VQYSKVFLLLINISRIITENCTRGHKDRTTPLATFASQKCVKYVARLCSNVFKVWYELRKVLFWRCLWLLCLRMKYLGNHWTDPFSEWFRRYSSNSHESRVWSLARRSKVKDQGHQGQNGIFRRFRWPACGL